MIVNQNSAKDFIGKLNKDNLPLRWNITVLDLTNVLSGPFATLNICLIWAPQGNKSRKTWWGRFKKVMVPLLQMENHGYFISLNRGKKEYLFRLAI